MLKINSQLRVKDKTGLVSGFHAYTYHNLDQVLVAMTFILEMYLDLVLH